MKIDPKKNKERYLGWQESIKHGISDMSKENADILLRYLADMQLGVNIASKSPKGARSYGRLNDLKDKMRFFSKRFKEQLGLDHIIDINEDQLIRFFADMRNGVFKKADGRPYTGIDTFGRVFKAFWHWHMKSNKKKGIDIPDITIDLDTRGEKPDWVYLTEEQVKHLAETAKYKYKVLILFLFDSGIRAPTELVNVRVSDLYNDCKELNIREESAKTFGRRIKLLLCSELVKQYIKDNNLKPEDQLFPINATVANRQLKRFAKRIFKDEPSPAGQSYWQLSMYDFRHCSCCYWLPRYKSESALKYRFGWKKSDKIHYYSELLGMKDTISEEDMLIDTTKTDIEKSLQRAENEKALMEEKMHAMELQMATVMELVKQVGSLKKE